MRFTELVIQTWPSNLELYSLVMEFWSAATTLPSRERFKDALQQVYGNMRNLVDDIIRGGMENGEFDLRSEPDKIAAAVVGALDSFLLQAWLDRDFDAQGFSQHFIDLLLKGLRRSEALI